jgi:hypothetical protein
LNTSKTVSMVARDPAYPGLVAAGFTDGTFGLYHLNLTTYPPPPEEIGGEDIGPIDDVNGNGNGNGEIPWGSAAADYFVIVLFVALAFLSSAYLWLRSRGPGSDEEGEDGPS